VRDTGEPFEPLDTGDIVLDEVPENTLTIGQWGMAELAPTGGPYTSWSGELRVQEVLNGPLPEPPEDGDTDVDTDAEPLACDLTYAMAGVASERTCDGCTVVFDVQFSLISGDRDGCHDPNLPLDASVWTLAWHPSRAVLLRDFPGSSDWYAWYTAALDNDVIALEWHAVVGVSVEEEEM